MSATHEQAARMLARVSEISPATLSTHSLGGWQILTRSGWSIISSPYSYGGAAGLWEAYGGGASDAEGWLTPDDVVSLLTRGRRAHL